MDLNEYLNENSPVNENEIDKTINNSLEKENLHTSLKKCTNNQKNIFYIILCIVIVLGIVLITVIKYFNNSTSEIYDEIFLKTTVDINLNDTEEMIRNLGYIIDGSKVYNGDELVASIVMTDNTVSTVIKYSASKDISGNIITNKLEDYQGNGDKKSYVAIKNNESVNVTDFYYQESEITNIVRYENGIFKEYCEIRNY